MDKLRFERAVSLTKAGGVALVAAEMVLVKGFTQLEAGKLLGVDQAAVSRACALVVAAEASIPDVIKERLLWCFGALVEGVDGVDSEWCAGLVSDVIEEMGMAKNCVPSAK